MQSAVTIRETTQHRIADHMVAVINVLERDFPAEDGVIREVSGVLSIMDVETEREWEELVRAGSVVQLGAERYCVGAVVEGDEVPGHLELRRVAP